EVVDEEPDQRYLTQRYTREAIDFIRDSHEGPFFLYLPHSMPHWPQYASEDFAGKSANGKWGDAVEEIDWSTGQILDVLTELGIDGQTLVLFMSDNGGAVRHGASNGPLKGGKGSTFEGGQRVCCVVRWPGHIPAGTSCDELTTSMDLLPTFARLAGGTVPADRTIDGQDIWSLLSGRPGAKTPHDAFFYYWMDTLECVRSGPWKLRVALKRRKSKEPFSPQLFNLSEDIGEASDVAAAHPQVVARLQKLAEPARCELGDGASTGTGQRAAGFVEDARALTGSRD
ncbi:MAG: sulfatase-like hydrolase/transferase, partial [Maioricimonas sp. JB049]